MARNRKLRNQNEKKQAQIENLQRKRGENLQMVDYVFLSNSIYSTCEKEQYQMIVLNFWSLRDKQSFNGQRPSLVALSQRNKTSRI